MKKLLLAGAASLTFLFAGCLGANHLTNGLYNWNAKVSDADWIKESVFVVMTPVYMVTTLGDWLVVNTMHYWSGENMVEDPGPFPGFVMK